MNELLKLVNTLKLNNIGSYKILDGKNVIAIIQLNTSKVWSVINTEDIKSYDVSKWRLEPTIVSPSSAESNDLRQWLWLVSEGSSELLNSMVDTEQKFYLDYWVKPKRLERTKVLALQTSIGKAPLKVNDIINKTGLSYDVVVNILGRLLFSGYLTKSCYKNLSFNNIHNSSLYANLSSNSLSKLNSKDSPLDSLLKKRAVLQSLNNQNNSKTKNQPMLAKQKKLTTRQETTTKEKFIKLLRQKLDKYL